MSEQFSLNLEAREPSPYESMDEAALKAAFLEKVGVPARIGKDSREELIFGITHPEDVRAAYQAEDAEDDKDDLRSTYRK